MAFSDLRKLFRLHLIDVTIVEIRKRAAALDPGRKVAAEVKAIETQLEQLGGAARAHHAEITDLELKAQAIEEKLKKFDKELYGGSVVNPREVENLQKEIEILKRQRSEIDDKTMALMESAPEGASEISKLETLLQQKKKEQHVQHKAALELKSKLEEEFKKKSAERPSLASEVPPAMLSRYDSIRQKLDGVGMTEINGDSCATCGTHLPERIIEGAKDGRLMTCESCHRIVYASEGLI